MYKATILGKEVCLIDKDFKQILRRFDIKNAVERSSNSYYGRKNGIKFFEIDIECPLCHKFAQGERFACSECPFTIFDLYGPEGCHEVIKSIVSGIYRLRNCGVIIGEAKDAINTEKIHSFLLKNFKKVERKTKG